MHIKVGKQAIADASEKLKNWGRWGADDQVGTLNHVTPEDIVKAAGLIRTGKVFALGIPLDRNGPQTGLFGGRWNPIHTMLATGTDAVAGRQDLVPNIRYADDAIHMPVQCATHWDSLYIFYEESMYNGYDARNVDCNGLGKLGIEQLGIAPGMHDVAGGIELDQRRRETPGVELVRQHVLAVEDEHVVLGVGAQAAKSAEDPMVGQRLRPAEVGLVMRRALRPR